MLIDQSGYSWSSFFRGVAIAACVVAVVAIAVVTIAPAVAIVGGFVIAEATIDAAVLVGVAAIGVAAVACEAAELAETIESLPEYSPDESADILVNSDAESVDLGGEGDSGSEVVQPDSPGQLQKEVEKGQAPRGVERVDDAHIKNPNVPNQNPHVHFKDGTSLNNNGTIHDKGGGTPNLNKKITIWLEGHGWKGN